MPFRWGGTCIEAQASGLPVVATNSSGIPDVVAHGRTGFLAAPGELFFGCQSLLAKQWRLIYMYHDARSRSCSHIFGCKRNVAPEFSRRCYS
eukprot:scaffold20544_cov31-Tisochrysis_lutea.AAC.3